MASNISVRLSVDGEQKFKKAMKDAAKSVNDVDSRLKLATAEFKKNGDAQKLMQTRTKTLNEEIKRQTQIVDALEDALKTTEQQYGENSTQALAYEAQLNRARQKLVQMETALDNNAKGLDENGKAFVESGKKAEKAAVSFTDLHHAIENVQNAAKNAATHVINFAKSAWGAMSGASEYADNLLTLSAQTGLSVEQLQKYAMAAGLVDTEASAIYTAIARMVNPTGEMATALEQLGVNTREIIGSQNFSGAMQNYVKDTDLADTKDIWSILHWMRTPSHAQILAEKAEGLRLAEKGLLKDVPEADAEAKNSVSSVPETADGTQDDDFEFTGEVTILNSSSDSEMVEKSYALLNLPEI